MVRVKKGQRFRREYKDGGNPTLILESLEDSNETSVRCSIVQEIRSSSTIEHGDWNRKPERLWWVLGNPIDYGYTYLEGQDAPQQ